MLPKMPNFTEPPESRPHRTRVTNATASDTTTQNTASKEKKKRSNTFGFAPSPGTVRSHLSHLKPVFKVPLRLMKALAPCAPDSESDTQALREKLNRAKQKSQQDEHDVRRLQEENLKRLESRTTEILDDSRIKQELEGLFAYVKDWSNNYRKPLGSLKESKWEDLCKYIVKVSPVQPDVLRRSSMIRTPLLVRAVVGYLLVKKILKKPFLGLDASLEKMLGVLYSKFGEDDPAAAHQWRSDFNRLLKCDRTFESSQHKVQYSRHDRYESEASFIHEIIDCLAKDDAPQTSTERLDSIREIAQRFGELAKKLWTQRSIFTGEGEQYLDSEYRFRRDDEFVMDFDEDEDNPGSGDGKKALLIIAPAIVKYGNGDGENYSTKVPLCPALLLLAPNDPTSASMESTMQGIN